MLSSSSPAKELSPRQIGWIGGGYLSMLGTLAGQTVFISLFGGSIREEFSISAGQYGLLYTVATLCSAVGLVFLGPLTDRFSPRLVGVGSLVGLAAACLAMSLSTSIGMLVFALFGLRFFGQGMLSHNCATALTRWFSRFRGRALAISQFGYSTGEAVLPVLVAIAIMTYGWRGVWQITAAVLVLLFIPAISLLFRGGSLPQATIAKQADTREASNGTEWNRGRVLRDGLFWWVLLGILANSGIVTLIFFHQADLVSAKGWSPLVFAASFPILSITSAVAGIIGGTLIDRFAAWRLLPYLLVPLCLANLVLWLGSDEWTIALFFFLTGASAGMVNGTASVVWAELYGMAHLGAVRALATAGLVFASAAGPGLAGMLIDAGIPLQRQCLYYALYCGLASVMYFILQNRIERRVKETAA
jgi:MFS family permease